MSPLSEALSTVASIWTSVVSCTAPRPLDDAPASVSPIDEELRNAARAAGLADIEGLLQWFAWRDPAVEEYEPSCAFAGRLEHCDALVVCGSAMAAVPIEAADLFVDVLHPAGCNAVVMSGGVGRGTLALWRELVERNLAETFGASWEVGCQPALVSLPTQGVSKPALAADAEVPSELDVRRTYCSEADIMLELFVDRCRARGLEVGFGGDPNAGGGDAGGAARPKMEVEERPRPLVFLETASTNSGANCALSAEALSRAVGLDMAAASVALVQHPQAHRRACLTWEKQFGKRPIGWAPRPTGQGVSVPEMLL